MHEQGRGRERERKREREIIPSRLHTSSHRAQQMS